jgi:small multidrug resistance pump
MTRWLLLLGAIVCEVTGSLSLKGALEHPALYVVVALGFASAFAFLAAVLRRGMPIGVAYGVWAALGVALTSVLSAVLYDEPFTALMAAGIALIMGGVLLVEVGSQHSPTRRQGAA